MTEAEAKERWERAKEATADARKGVSEARAVLQRAERSLNKMWDAERRSWRDYQSISSFGSKVALVLSETNAGKERRVDAFADCD